MHQPCVIFCFPHACTQVAKNLVLAGVGFVAIADDSRAGGPSSSGNFLVPYSASLGASASAGGDGAPSCSVAEASVATLQAMNPLIKVRVQPMTPSSSTPSTAAGGGGQAGGGGGAGRGMVDEELLKGYDTVVASVSSFSEIQALEDSCTSKAVPGKECWYNNWACCMVGSGQGSRVLFVYLPHPCSGFLATLQQLSCHSLLTILSSGHHNAFLSLQGWGSSCSAA